MDHLGCDVVVAAAVVFAVIVAVRGFAGAAADDDSGDERDAVDVAVVGGAVAVSLGLEWF